MAYVPDLDRRLAVGSRYQREDTTYVIEAHWLGNVTLPSGQVIGCGPFDIDEHTAPFTVTVTPGSYLCGHGSRF